MEHENPTETAPENDTPTDANIPAADATPPAQDGTDWKAEARKWEARAKENGKAAEQLKAIEDAKKSELEKANERATQAEAKAAQLEAKQLRTEVAAEAGIPAALAARLTGATREELLADAKALAELVKPSGGSSVPMGTAQGSTRNGKQVFGSLSEAVNAFYQN